MACRSKPQHEIDQVKGTEATSNRTTHPLAEQTAEVTGTPAQQICDWITAHNLQACRVCGAFRITELELAEFLSALRSRR